MAFIRALRRVMPEAAERPEELKARGTWARQPERGSLALLRAMAWVSLKLGRRAGRGVLYIIVLYYFLFSPTAAHHSRAYLRRVLGRAPRARDRFRQLLAFSTMIHDRVYLLNDRFELFDIEVGATPVLEQALAEGTGCFLIGAHLGSFEVMRSFGRRVSGVEVVVAMYDQNARKISGVLEAINPRAQPEIIPLGTIDAMLRIRARLGEGAFVGMLADRTFGAEARIRVSFLGSPAPFPVGPWRAAALLRRRVLFVAGIYCGANRYRVVIDEVADFSEIGAPSRDAAVVAAIERYAALLEQYCRRYPYNWFNFFDFWQEQGPSARG
jgi:predicted LPLAT superfamily acyltransferase